jgi:hypothetical protein
MRRCGAKARVIVQLATVVMGSALWGLGGVDPTVGTAQAVPGSVPLYPWCPGQKWQYLTPPPPGFDMTVCHNLTAESNGDGTFRIVELPPAPPPRMCGPVPCGLFP